MLAGVRAPGPSPYPASVILDQTLREELLAHAREDLPNECCGLIGGTPERASTVYRATNSEASPLRYNLDPADQFRIISEIDSAGEELVAIYHSHTKSPAYPSQTDVNLATYPGVVYVIVSLAEGEDEPIRGFLLEDGEVEEVALESG